VIGLRAFHEYLSSFHEFPGEWVSLLKRLLYFVMQTFRPDIGRLSKHLWQSREQCLNFAVAAQSYRSRERPSDRRNVKRLDKLPLSHAPAERIFVEARRRRAVRPSFEDWLEEVTHDPIERLCKIGQLGAYLARRGWRLVDCFYFVTIRRVGVTVLVGAIGEIENVNHVFHPAGRLAASNSPYPFRLR
jgi:hypothetical protein